MERDSVVYMKEFFDMLKEYFFASYKEVPILLTVGKPTGKPLLAAANPYLNNNHAVGVDAGEPPRHVIDFFEKKQMPFTFAAGTSSPFASPVKFKKVIKEAIDLKQQTDDLKLVYTWTANSEKTMRDFVDVGVDGMITDKVERLRNLIDSKYRDTIELATADHNPFASVNR
jgi:glycerophosphoryl diester phosphodiesterase